jgi:hypothetical protein
MEEMWLRDPGRWVCTITGSGSDVLWRGGLSYSVRCCTPARSSTFIPPYDYVYGGGEQSLRGGALLNSIMIRRIPFTCNSSRSVRSSQPLVKIERRDMHPRKVQIGGKYTSLRIYIEGNKPCTVSGLRWFLSRPSPRPPINPRTRHRHGSETDERVSSFSPF